MQAYLRIKGKGSFPDGVHHIVIGVDRDTELFPDFKTLYRRLRNLGMILTINTNGTLLDEAWADFFATYPPRRINITLYGADAASYDRLCHFPQGFDQTLRAVRLLRARNVDVKISCSVTKKNPQDFSRIFALGKWHRRS